MIDLNCPFKNKETNKTKKKQNTSDYFFDFHNFTEEKREHFWTPV